MAKKELAKEKQDKLREKKKEKKKKLKSKQNDFIENALPQNILPMGERVEESKNIYISQKVYKEIHKFTKNKTTNESGGMLVGTVIEEFGKTNIVIQGFVEAKYCEATPTTLTFTHQTWEFVHGIIDRKYDGQKIIGWIHTHPDFGIFMSEYDKFIHQNFFSEDYQVAYLVDPIQGSEGFYFWINGNLEKCTGFYIFDKNEVDINIDIDYGDVEDETETKPEPMFSGKNIMIAILTAAVILLTFSHFSLSNELKEIKTKQQTLEANVNTLGGSVTPLLQMFGLLPQQVEPMPGEITDAPVEGEQPPVEGEQPPVEGEQPPVEGEQPTADAPAETPNNAQGDIANE